MLTLIIVCFVLIKIEIMNQVIIVLVKNLQSLCTSNVVGMILVLKTYELIQSLDFVIYYEVCPSVFRESLLNPNFIIIFAEKLSKYEIRGKYHR